MTELVPRDAGAVSVEVQQLLADARRAAERSRAPETIRSRRVHWETWRAWCAQHGIDPMPATPDELCAFVAREYHRGLRVSSIRTCLAHLSTAHRAAGHVNSLDGKTTVCNHAKVRATLAGYERLEAERDRAAGRARVARKTPVLLDDLDRALTACGGGVVGVRNRALLTFGWASAMRRSEVCALHVSDLTWVAPGGVIVHIWRSKTDQAGGGQRIGIEHSEVEARCPCCLVLAWLAAMGEQGHAGGPLFRRVFADGTIGHEPLHPSSFARLVEDVMLRAGLPGDWAAHSLRAGLVTQAELAGVEDKDTMRTTRHVRREQLRAYVRDANPLRNTAAHQAGL